MPVSRAVNPASSLRGLLFSSRREQSVRTDHEHECEIIFPPPAA